MNWSWYLVYCALSHWKITNPISSGRSMQNALWRTGKNLHWNLILNWGWNCARYSFAICCLWMWKIKPHCGSVKSCYVILIPVFCNSSNIFFEFMLWNAFLGSTNYVKVIFPFLFFFLDYLSYCKYSFLCFLSSSKYKLVIGDRNLQEIVC